jgi:hypothetical protein
MPSHCSRKDVEELRTLTIVLENSSADVRMGRDVVEAAGDLKS